MRSASLLALLGVPGVADAYVVATTDEGEALHWENAPTLSADESLDAVTGSAEASRGVVEEAARSWSGVPGADLELRTKSSTGGVPGYDADHPEDNRSEVIASPTVPGADSSALAVTLVTYDSATGRIVDTDVVVRSRGIAFGFGGEPGHYDLPGVLTHEIGHALGLAHEPDHEDATMFPESRRGDTSQRSLSADDEAGLVAIYGAASARGVASCSAAPGGPASPFAIGAVALAIALWRRR